MKDIPNFKKIMKWLAIVAFVLLDVALLVFALIIVPSVAMGEATPWLQRFIDWLAGLF